MCPFQTVLLFLNYYPYRCRQQQANTMLAGDRLPKISLNLQRDGLLEEVLTSVHVSWIGCFSQIQDILLQGEVAEGNFVGSFI